MDSTFSEDNYHLEKQASKLYWRIVELQIIADEYVCKHKHRI